MSDKSIEWFDHNGIENGRLILKDDGTIEIIVADDAYNGTISREQVETLFAHLCATSVADAVFR